MSYNNTSFPYHYAQDFTKNYSLGYVYIPGNPVYAMQDGEIIRIRKSGSYGGGNPCDSDYNTMVVKYQYFDKNGFPKPVYVFYGHVRGIKGSTDPINLKCADDSKALCVNIPVDKGEAIAELNDPSCAGWAPHLHLSVMRDKLPSDYYDGYNDTQTPNGRSEPFDLWDNANGSVWSKDWVDINGVQNLQNKDDAFFDTYKPYQPPQNNLVAYYPFDGNANDESGNGNDGIVHGAKFTSDKFGNPNSACYFDGIDDFIEAQPLGIQIGDSFTISFWLKFDWQEHRMWVLRFGSDYCCEGFDALINVNNEWGFNAGVTQFGIWSGVQNQFNVADRQGQWLHVATVYDKDRQILKSYVNGQMVDSNVVTEFPFQSAGLYIAQRAPSIIPWQKDSFFKGAIDEVRIYKRALSEYETQELYQSSGGTVLPPIYMPVQEIHSQIDQGEHHWWDFFNDAFHNLIVKLGFGSTFNIKIYKPDGTLYSEQQSNTSPIEVFIPSADPGQWRFEVSAIVTPIPDDPYVLAIGKKKETSMTPAVLQLLLK